MNLLQDCFFFLSVLSLVVFFLSVGLLIDVGFFFENLGTLIVVFILATIAKGLINIIAVRIAGQPWEQSVLVGVTLGQIGEFAFVIASVGFTVNAIDSEGYKIAVAVIALSLMLGPAWVVLERRLRAAEDLGIKLTAAEKKTRENIREKLAIFVSTSPIWGSQLKTKMIGTFASFLILMQKYLTHIRKK